MTTQKQEPVAWRWKYKFRDIGETGAYEYHSHEFACLTHMPQGEPLYTTPPQRTWVGLTPQERDEINERVYGAVPHHVAFHAAIEQALREKNT